MMMDYGQSVCVYVNHPRYAIADGGERVPDGTLVNHFLLVRWAPIDDTRSSRVARDPPAARLGSE